MKTITIPLFISAVVVETVKPHLCKDGDMWCATWPDFINLQESPAGFGETTEIAIANLEGITS